MTRLETLLSASALTLAVSAVLAAFALGWGARMVHAEHNHARCPLDGMILDGTRAEIDTWQCDAQRCAALIVITRKEGAR